MKRIIAERCGGPEVLVLAEEKMPEPGPCQPTLLATRFPFLPVVMLKLETTSVLIWHVE